MKSIQLGAFAAAMLLFVPHANALGKATVGKTTVGEKTVEQTVLEMNANIHSIAEGPWMTRQVRADTSTPNAFLRFDRLEDPAPHPIPNSEVFAIHVTLQFTVNHIQPAAEKMTTEQEIQKSTWLAEVEHIFVPDPGIIAMMTLAFGGAICFASMRRKRS